MRTSLLLLALAACSSLPNHSAVEIQPLSGPAEGADTIDRGAGDTVDGAWLVRIDGSMSDAQLQSRLAELGAGALEPVAGTPNTYRFSSSAPPTLVGQLAELDTLVGWIEPVVRYYPLATAPNDPYFELQWHHTMLGTLDAWDTTQGEGIVVAVVDTGVHTADVVPDAPVNLLEGIAYVDSEIPNDDVGHGTHIANIIAQNANNEIGAAGIAPGVSILPIRALGKNGGTSDDVASGIRYAVDNGADIINLSLGSPLYSDIIAEACQYARDNGVLIFAASGNDGNDHFISFPAALQTTVAVGAIGPDGLVTDYSNRGPELDLAAPGGVNYDYDRNGMYDGILADTVQEVVGLPGYEDGWYGGSYFLSGTSMATATASASAAMLMSAGADADTALDLLRSTAIDEGEAGWDGAYGNGSIDLAGAMAAFNASEPVQPPVDPCAADACGEEVAGLSLRISEVMANPATCADAHGEWIEIVNEDTVSIALDGLILEDAGQTRGVLQSDRVLAPGERAVLGRGDPAAFCGPDIDGSFGNVNINNENEQLDLITESGALIDAAPDWAGTIAGTSFERDGAGWAASVTPMGEEFGTPGAAAAPSAPDTMADLWAGDLIATEFMANPSVCASDSCEWIEIRSNWSQPIALDGLRIGDASGTFVVLSTDIVLAPGKIAVLGRGSAASWAHPDFVPDAFYGNLMLNNSGDSIVLDSGDAVLFSLDYTGAFAQSGVSAEYQGGLAEDLMSWAPATSALDSGELATPGM